MNQDSAVLNFDTVQTNDDAAIAELHRLFDAQRAAYFANPEPTLEERLELIGRIPGMMVKNYDRIVAAFHADYGNHPALTTTLFDFLNVIERAQQAMENLAKWMQRDERPLPPELYGSSLAYIRHQPKGVIGNLSAWNFPFDISFGPLVDMLAAGNRVIIKPSEQVPACGELMREMIAETYAPEQVAVVTGGIGLASHFSTLRWDHLLYTGNTRIGREVALKAAENLVPVTLELGGKNPVIFTEDSVTPQNVANMLGVKVAKNGQICINADHAFVPRAQQDRFVQLAREHLDSLFEDYTTDPDVCNVINKRQWTRLQAMISELRERAPQSLVEIGSPATTEGGCRMPFTIAVDPPKDSLVATTEVFGPILPLIPYGDIDEVIHAIQQGERPLGIYMYSEQPDLIEKVRCNTSSGGFVVNCCALHGAQGNLGFGGVGHSGHGRHHGIEGFKEFSNPRAYVELKDDAAIDPLLAPHREITGQFVQAMMG
ncbi:MAG: aldehyde dehydrogenase family protein [Sphingomonadales bacterium]|nr:aldehyde dehydrogenase family protein [Sphingomonadales bacterium]